MPGLEWDQTDRRRLVGLCATITGDADAAEDLAQETLYEAWRNAHKLHNVSGAESWVNAIARNVCRRWARREGIHRSHLTDVTPPDDIADDLDIELDLERGALVDLLDRALALVPEPTRGILVARYLEESSHAEIAERLGLSCDAVSMRVSRGKVMLRRVLETDLRTAAEPHVARGLQPDAPRTTSIWCAECGSTKLVMLTSTAPDQVSFRCPRCTPSPQGRTHVFDLTNPTFARLLGSVGRPSAILGRTAQWVDRYFRAGELGRAADRHVGCTRCGRDVRVRRFRREGSEFSEMSRIGLYVDCAVCHQEVCSSLTGLALALPDIRAFRRRHPRISVRTLRNIESGGRASLVLGFRSPVDGGAVDVVYDEQTLDVLGVHTVAG